VLLMIGLVARGCAGSDDEPAAATQPDASVVAQVASVPTPLTSSPVEGAPSAAPAVPQVSIEELPREKRKKVAAPGAATPAKKDDPFARRR